MNTILVVEDDDDARTIVVELLRTEGYEVREAQSGEIALQVLSELEKQPCLILLDWMMPAMDGRMFLNALGASHKLASLPVVVITAGNLDRAAGARRVFKKPISLGLLLALVKDYCKADPEAQA